MEEKNVFDFIYFKNQERLSGPNLGIDASFNACEDKTNGFEISLSVPEILKKKVSNTTKLLLSTLWFRFSNSLTTNYGEN